MFPPLPPMTRALLYANVAVFVLQLLLGGAFFMPFMLWPVGDYPSIGPSGALTAVGFMPWQLLTYGFLHGNYVHLIFNMLALYFFGPPLEYTWGERRFLAYFMVCIVGAGLTHLGMQALAPLGGGPTIGASGGVYGLLLGYGMLFPNQRVMLLFPPIPMRARTLAIVFGGLELFMGVTGTQDGVAHFAHLGGMLFGFGMIQYWRGRWPFDQHRRRGGPWRPH